MTVGTGPAAAARETAAARSGRVLAVARPTAVQRAALDYVARWGWPVMVGAPIPPGANFGLGAEDAVLEPTTDAERVRAWWLRWPQAGIVVPAGAALDVVTLPMRAGQAVLDLLTERGSWLGPVMSDDDTIGLLVSTGQQMSWTRLLAANGRGHVHAGHGQLVVLPPASPHTGHNVRWVVPPTDANAPHLPSFDDLGPVIAAVLPATGPGPASARGSVRAACLVPGGRRSR